MLFLLLYMLILLCLVSADAPDIVVVGYDGDWHVGRESVLLTCKAKANPPAHHFRWIRFVSVCDRVFMCAQICSHCRLNIEPVFVYNCVRL